MPERQVAIIGGGAAGLSAAIAASRLGARVTLLEGGARVGRTILTSGNGRCNLTNLRVAPRAYNHPEFVGSTLTATPCEGIRAYFGEMGLLTYADDEGRVYPVSNAAGSVLDVLRLECAHLGVEERCGFAVTTISVEAGGSGFTVVSREGESVTADAIVVTTGGGDSVLAHMGHRAVECVPVLGPLNTETALIRGLSGVRVKCAATLLGAHGETEPIAAERGELLFREYGVSGIMIFDLSRFVEQGSVLSIDFLPDMDRAELLKVLTDRCASLGWRSADTFFHGMLHSRVAQAVLRAGDIDPKMCAIDLPCERLVSLLKDFQLQITGRGDAEQAQVTRGGAAVEEFEATTMESLRIGGLFAAGEVLDIDGRCGGFNLHWAWASGIIAGENAARAASARAASVAAATGGAG